MIERNSLPWKICRETQFSPKIETLRGCHLINSCSFFNIKTKTWPWINRNLVTKILLKNSLYLRSYYGKRSQKNRPKMDNFFIVITIVTYIFFHIKNHSRYVIGPVFLGQWGTQWCILWRGILILCTMLEVVWNKVLVKIIVRTKS